MNCKLFLHFVQEVDEFLLGEFLFVDEEAEHGAQVAAEEGLFHVVHGLANVFALANLSNIIMCLALAVLLEIIDKALLVERTHLCGECRVGRLRVELFVNLAGRDGAVDVPDDGHDVVLRLAEDSLSFVRCFHLCACFLLQNYGEIEKVAEKNAQKMRNQQVFNLY